MTRYLEAPKTSKTLEIAAFFDRVAYWHRVKSRATWAKIQLIDKFGPHFKLRPKSSAITGRSGWAVYTDECHINDARDFVSSKVRMRVRP